MLVYQRVCFMVQVWNMKPPTCQWCLSPGRGQNLVHANEKCLFDKVWRNIMDQNTLHICIYIYSTYIYLYLYIEYIYLYLFLEIYPHIMCDFWFIWGGQYWKPILHIIISGRDGMLRCFPLLTIYSDIVTCRTSAKLASSKLTYMWAIEIPCFPISLY